MTMSRRPSVTVTAALFLLVGGLGLVQPSHSDGVDIRVYDRGHHDYHNWNDHEDRVYRSYREGRKEDYQDFRKIDREHQRGYWNWRHEHPDAE
jgi:hypothetical protein